MALRCYIRRFVKRDVLEFVKPCVSMPFDLTLESLQQRIACVIRQKLHKSWPPTMREVRENIRLVLNCRRDAALLPHWDDFLNALPDSSDTLGRLAREYGGPVQVRPDVPPGQVLSMGYYLDTIVLDTSAVGRTGRLAKLKEMGIFSTLRNTSSGRGQGAVSGSASRRGRGSSRGVETLSAVEE